MVFVRFVGKMHMVKKEMDSSGVMDQLDNVDDEEKFECFRS